MIDYNKVIQMGNLTRDPELAALPNGDDVCSFTLATDNSYSKQSGERVSETCFIDVVCFGKNARTVAAYCQKGSRMFIEGRLRLQKWTTRDGEKRSKHEIKAFRILFPERRRDEEDAG